MSDEACANCDEKLVGKKGVRRWCSKCVEALYETLGREALIVSYVRQKNRRWAYDRGRAEYKRRMRNVVRGLLDLGGGKKSEEEE